MYKSSLFERTLERDDPGALLLAVSEVFKKTQKPTTKKLFYLDCMKELHFNMVLEAWCSRRSLDAEKPEDRSQFPFSRDEVARLWDSYGEVMNKRQGKSREQEKKFVREDLEKIEAKMHKINMSKL